MFYTPPAEAAEDCPSRAQWSESPLVEPLLLQLLSSPLPDEGELDVDAMEARLQELKIGTKPEARCRHSAHMLNSTLHIIGGYDGFKPHGGDIFTLEIDDAAKVMKAAAKDDH